jgi:phosphate transport system substrate-binding protein
MILFPCASFAQGASTLAQVKKIYVEPFAGKRGTTEIRNELIDRLRRDRALILVDNAAQSDAVLKGTGDIWISGHIGNNPRAQGSSRSPIYTGYLSLTLEGGDSQPLWSSLVTPASSLSGAITSNLADHGAKLLLTAVANERTNGAPSPNPSIASAAAVQQSLQGAGATFPAPLYRAWIESYRQAHPGVRISYDAVGSEEGIARLVGKKVDFAASDIAASPPGSELQRFATVLGAVVPIYNLAGLDRGLRFTPEVLAGIYLGKITRWNAPEIRDINRGFSLPNAPIAVVYRSEGSGTSYAFTEFLSKTSPEWKTAVGAGSTVKWTTGVGASGNDGVAALVAKTPDSIGYVELTYAIQHELSFGQVRNAAGAFVAASLESVAAAAQNALASGATLSIVDAPGKASYPIATFTWILLPEPVPAADRTAITQMLQWMLTSGQKQSSALGYQPLPHELASRELQSLGQLK